VGAPEHLSTPEHLNSHHRDTLAHIFRHPAGNVEWHAVLSLLNSVADVHETHKGKVVVTIGEHVETFDTQHHKDVDPDQLAYLRQFLRKAGYGPEGDSA